jgi:acetyl esterase
MRIGSPEGSEPVGDDALDSELRPIVEAQRARAAARLAMGQATPQEMRVRAAAEFAFWNENPEPMETVRDFVAGGVPVRLYHPHPGRASGLLVYCHGGGWVIGDLDLEDAALRRISLASGVPILSVDYRLAPEHPFPAQLEDVEAAFQWAGSEAHSLGICPQRIGLGGASAGANLALGAALRLRDGGRPLPVLLLLMYGAYSGGAATPSTLAFGDGRFGLPRAAMDWFWAAYAGRDRDNRHPHSVPMEADLGGLPPTFLNHAELDILRDDTVLLAELLRRAGVPVEHRGYAGAVHGFTQYAKGSALARRALDDAARAVAASLG